MAKIAHHTPDGCFGSHGFKKMKTEHDDGRYHGNKASGGSKYEHVTDEHYEDAMSGTNSPSDQLE